MTRFLVTALLLASVSPGPALAAPTVEVADGNWSWLPQMRQRSNAELSNIAIGEIREIAQTQKCGALVTKKDAVEIDISFAAHFAPDGTPTRIVMPRLNCPEVESILGGVLREMVEKGDYRPDGRNSDGWYRGTLSFTVS
jgi:hypothetical protein